MLAPSWKGTEMTRPPRTVDFAGGTGRWALVCRHLNLRYPELVLTWPLYAVSLQPSLLYVLYIRPSLPYIIDVRTTNA